MNVPSRTSTAEKLLRAPFRGRSRQIRERESQAQEFDEVRVTRITRRQPPVAPAQFQSALDEATFSCQCGYIFQAPVLTSVDCPHCGDAQAW